MAGEQYRTGWGKLDRWHAFYARELARDIVTVREIAILRDAADVDMEAIDAVEYLAHRLAGDEA